MLRLTQLEYYWRIPTDWQVVYRLEWITEARDMDWTAPSHGEVRDTHVAYILGTGGEVETEHFIEDAPSDTKSTIVGLCVYGCNATLMGLSEEEEEAPGINLPLDEGTGLSARKKLHLAFYSSEDDPIGSLSLTWDHNVLQLYEVDSDVPLGSFSVPDVEYFSNHSLQVQGVAEGQSTLKWQYDRHSGENTMRDVITVRVGEPEIRLLVSPSACDGEEVPVRVLISPTSAVPTQVKMWMDTPEKVKNYGNLCKELSHVEPGTDQLNWVIPNARWYATQSDFCNDAAPYRLCCEVTFQSNVVAKTERIFMAAAVSLNCADARAKPVSVFSGEIAIHAEEYLPKRWRATVSQGTFVRDVKATIENNVSPNSQFYALTVAEETYHKTQQYENPNHPILQNYWSADDIMYQLTHLQNQPRYFYGGTKAAAEEAARREWKRLQLVKRKEDNERLEYPNPDRCLLEKEAKDAVGSTYRLKMKCAYPWCK